MKTMEIIRADLAHFYKYNNDWKVSYKKTAILKAILSHRFFPIFLFRISQSLNEKGWGNFARIICLLNFWLHGIEISLKTQIAPGIYLPHPNGVIIGAKSIGKMVVIAQQVTLGAAIVQENTGDIDDRPVIGDNVLIGPGAKIFGDVFVKNDSKIPANSVVTHKNVNF